MSDFDERDFAIRAVATNGLVLRYASLAFRNDLEIVMLAAKSDRRALRFASVSVATEVSQKFAEHLAPLLADAVVPKINYWSRYAMGALSRGLRLSPPPRLGTLEFSTRSCGFSTQPLHSQLDAVDSQLNRWIINPDAGILFK